ncbi:MAG TPA: aminotransferase class V-fold PLP-dependent enzyme [Gemmatimonadaceae bacterium]|nr:aminotransferase class V-fold PLP-dependent enzyme [Gemmatimonadaceae bacterium]
MTAASQLYRVLSHESDADPLFDDLRATEYCRLDADNQAYLDYTGSALYSTRQVNAHGERLRNLVLGNPHSENGPSLVSTAIINDAKARILRFVDASADDYVVCFTANTSAAIKLVAESFQFGPDTPLVLAADNHNSMNGVREFARSRDAAVHYLPLDERLRLRSPKTFLREHAGKSGGLFGFPAQSNFSGVKHPLELIQFAQRLGYTVLLDAAAFLPTSRLSLRDYPADFVAFSIYKITGYPSGVGALVARKSALRKLERSWFAGGTVEYASVQHGAHLLREGGEGFEDGTPAFLNILAVRDGLELLEEIGMARVNAHVTRLANKFAYRLERLTARDGSPLAVIYGDANGRDRGPTVAFNLHNRGKYIPFAHVVERARNEGVALRGGCFCNPGASEAAFGFPAERTARCLREASAGGFTIERFSACLGGEIPVGAVRASMGIPTNDNDIDRAIAVIASF